MGCHCFLIHIIIGLGENQSLVKQRLQTLSSIGTILSFSTGSNRGLGTIATLLALLGAVALGAVITLAVNRRATSFTSVGSGVMTRPVALHREPSESTETPGAVGAGEPVELLQYLPSKTMDAWVLIRPTSR